ncbi:HNH endonuclease [Nostoc sp. XA010]|uniref:HNH endonuclease n=1 Tax=Nostoc sp. XA010 TaxID=2780407 RepID=UPI001E42EAE7|nr:HNH endonuclease [Nostoc sp. XA010]MCC5656639.1 HNH endonuclease [Nostoc sp. XA010]
MMKITPNKILYINLGPDNKWRKDCIYTDNTIRLGHIEVSHQLCLECKSKNKWSEVEEELKKYFTKNKVVKRCKQISNFYVSDENTLWITIFEKKLWWCFANTDITERSDSTKERTVIGRWSCNNILGEPLELEYLNEKIQKSRLPPAIYEFKHPQEILEAINTREYQKIKNNFLEDYPELKNEIEEVLIKRIKRVQQIVLKIKNKYNNCCQFENCGFRFMKNNGGFYSEAHHLNLLSHEGSQDENNVVILCPNHHRMLHYAQVEPIQDKENNKRLVKINGKDYFIIYK